MISVNLFTNSLNFVKIIKKFLRINQIFIDKKNNINLIKFCKENNIHLIKVKKFSGIKKEKLNGSNLAIIYSFGIIFPKNYIDNYKFGMWNVHPGDLPKYRGRHPITWAFLNNEKKIFVTIHKIDEKIDRGKLLIKTFVKRTFSDDNLSVEKKILKKLPKLIPSALKKIKSKKLLKIKKGNYFPPLYKGIKIKDPKNYDHLYIYNAIKSQAIFGGVKVGKSIFTKVMFYSKKNKIKNKKSFLIVCRNNKKLILIK